ncbi:nudC domain-containing protein 3 isoform X7 [Takifugu rubripes]|uniref:nudC domain-containing protein 3 isoform X7 n=1 Tax=Takifugu rubripes TaxID=31033 RepID=UPI0005D269E5|nr:nudC domain-containing protein 3 isoform X7 [Takifugu rubripes]|eukprot:XP_011603073.1 PREDICTED: nudC domain-containing protein 3 [Takifugu rubripes]
MASLEMSEMYDNALLGILQHVGNIQDFLQVFFGFLYRKTDFYRLLSSPNDKMGFPPGVAEKMVLKTFKLFEKLADHDRERLLTELRRRDESQCVPPVAQELEISESHKEPEEQRVEAAQLESSSANAVEGSSQVTVCSSSETGSSGSGGGSSGGGAPAQASAASKGSDQSQNRFQENPDSYNGAVRENYSWSQDYSDVEVRVFVPKTIIKGRQVTVSLQTNSVKVCVRDGAEEKTLMEGELTNKINTENSLWSLEPGNCVILSLSKTSEVWWNAVLKGEKEIDIDKINRERSMATVDEEEHAVLDRLTFDYQQKLQGKPQSHEMKVHDMLKKGWDVEGSPFKGQEFDPSMFDIPPGAVQF